MSCPVVAHVHPSPRRGVRHPILLRRSFTAAQPTFFAPCVNPVDLYDPQKHQGPQIGVSPVRAKQVRAPTNAREGRVPVGLLLNQPVDQRRTAGVRLGEVRSIDAPATATAADEVVIVAGQTGRRYFQDLWRYRELFLFRRGETYWCDINRPSWESAGRLSGLFLRCSFSRSFSAGWGRCRPGGFLTRCWCSAVSCHGRSLQQLYPKAATVW